MSMPQRTSVLVVALGLFAVWMFGVGLAGLLYLWMGVIMPARNPVEQGGIGAGIAIAFSAFAPYLAGLLVIVWTVAIVGAVVSAIVRRR